MDGPVGTELARRGVPTPLPGWSVAALETHPEVIAAIHAEYAAAGATVHCTNTFRTRPRTAGPAWQRLARRAVELCRSSIPSDHRVAGSVAPLQDCYRPDLSPPKSFAEHARLAEVLATEGCDLLLCETFAHPGEAVAAVSACARTGLPVWCGLTAGPSGALMVPSQLADAALRCVDAGAEVVLVNCVGARLTLAYVEALVGLGVPVGAYANAGNPNDRIGWSAGPPGPERYTCFAQQWRNAGASVIGGCCGTTPAHIAALQSALSPTP